MHTARHKRSAPDPAFPKMLPASARAGCSQARRVHPAREVQLLHAPWARSGHLCSSKQPLPPWSSSLPSSFSLGFALEMEAASVWVPRAVAWSRVAWHGMVRHGTAWSPRCLCCGVARCSTVPQPGRSADRSSTSTTSSLLAASTPTSPSPCPHQSGRQHWDGSGRAGAAITLLLPVTSPLQKARRAGRRPCAPFWRPRKFPSSEGINR